MFERYSERVDNVNIFLHKYDINSIEEAESICTSHGVDAYGAVRNIQPIAFKDAQYAYMVGIAAAIKNGEADISTVCRIIGEGLQSFAIPGSVADLRQIGAGHGAFAARLLDPATKNFAFIAGHESFAAAEGALGVIGYANKYRETPITVNLVGLGKPVAEIISRYKGFTYVETYYDYHTGELKILDERKYGDGAVRCYGAHSVDEGVAILLNAKIDTFITGNSTSHIKFTDPTAATYKKVVRDMGGDVFSVASGGGTGRTMHPDNVGAGGASYGMTDTTGRMHSNLQFAGSSSVPAHVEMVGFIGMGNNPMVGATVCCACLAYNAINVK